VNRILLILCVFITLACFAPAIHLAAAPSTAMPAISPALPVATVTQQPGSQPASVWPMLCLSGLIAAGGLAVMRKIAGTIS
jgi:hypothetical protein